MIQERIHAMFISQTKAVRQMDAALLAALIVFVVVVASCGRKDAIRESGKERASEQAFHADADIAMTVRSLADALKVGAPTMTMKAYLPTVRAVRYTPTCRAIPENGLWMS